MLKHRNFSLHLLLQLQEKPGTKVYDWVRISRSPSIIQTAGEKRMALSE